MKLRLRQATPADFTAVAALWLESAHAAFADLLPAGRELPRWVPGRFKALLHAPEIEMLVAEEELLRGFITFRLQP